jgi:hypothetical protein
MGLDMYLNRKTYVRNWDFMQEKRKTKIIIKKDGKDISGIDTSKISHIIENVMTWRKANQIHNWFVKNIQNGIDDCKEYDVGIEDLEKLLDTCKKVLEDNTKAPKLLPCTEGFFFGSTDYNEYYFDDVQETKGELEKIIEHYNTERDNLHQYFTYQSSW